MDERVPAPSDGMDLMAATVIDTPDGIDFYRLCVLRGMLNMQAAGMRPRRGTRTPLQAVREDYGVTARTCRDAVAQLNAIIDSRIEARRG